MAPRPVRPIGPAIISRLPNASNLGLSVTQAKNTFQKKNVIETGYGLESNQW